MLPLLLSTAGAQSYASLGEMILANLPGIILLVVGFVLVLIEMYVPGFGFPGIVGIVLLGASIVLLSKGDVVLGLVITAIIVALLCVMLSITIRSASKGRLKKSKLVLNDVFDPEVSADDMTYYVGRKGMTHTVLRPAGIGEFSGVKLNIVSDGEFLASGEEIIVERVEGNRIFVRKTNGE